MDLLLAWRVRERIRYEGVSCRNSHDTYLSVSSLDLLPTASYKPRLGNGFTMIRTRTGAMPTRAVKGCLGSDPSGLASPCLLSFSAISRNLTRLMKAPFPWEHSTAHSMSGRVMLFSLAAIRTQDRNSLISTHCLDQSPFAFARFALFLQLFQIQALNLPVFTSSMGSSKRKKKEGRVPIWPLLLLLTILISPVAAPSQTSACNVAESAYQSAKSVLSYVSSVTLETDCVSYTATSSLTPRLPSSPRVPPQPLSPLPPQSTSLPPLPSPLPPPLPPQKPQAGLE